MNMIIAFAIEVLLTLTVCSLMFKYLRPFLNRILIDLCGTEDRATFWTVFSNILLVGFPVLISLLYRPGTIDVQELFFEITRRASGNIISFMVTLVGIGFIVSVFAMLAPRTKESK